MFFEQIIKLKMFIIKQIPVIISILFISNICYGVNIRHDVSDSDYIEYAQNKFFESGLVVIRPSIETPATGVIIHPKYILTAAHVGAASGATQIPISYKGKEYMADYVYLFPDYSSEQDFITYMGYDISILRLEGNGIENAAPSVIWTKQVALGQSIVGVGQGRSSTGLDGSESISSGTFRGYENSVDYILDDEQHNLLVTDFDSPEGSCNSLSNTLYCLNSMAIVGNSSPDPLQLEGSLGAGDSGSGIWINENGNYYLVGIASGRYYASYCAQSVYVNLTNKEIYDWIFSICPQLPDSITSYEILTSQSPPLTIEKGEYVKVFGSSVFNNSDNTSNFHTITVKSSGRLECVNFVGQNIINIEDNASDFTVYRSGATVYLKNAVSGTQIKIPATKKAQTLKFIDGSYELLISSGKVFIDEQEITLNAASLNNDTQEVTLNTLKNAISQLKTQPSNKALQNITNYISGSSSETVKKALYLIMEYENSELLVKNQNVINSIKIDGELSDWTNVENTYEDKEKDIAAINSSLPIGAYSKSDDLKKDGVIHGNGFIYCMLEPFEMPQNNSEYHYRTNILNSEDKLVYAVVWTNYGNFIQEWDSQNSTFIKNIDINDALFAKKNGFEAKIPTDKLNNLPEYYHTQAVVWHEHKNSLDTNYIWSLETSIENRYGYRYSLDVFCQYAEKMDFTLNDPFPIVQAITEGYIYKLAENEIRPTVIDDGLEMIKQSEKSMNYSFQGQASLKATPIEAILLWADRSIMFGGYRGANLELLKSGRLNKDAYNFLILKPSILDTIRTIMENNGLIELANLANTMLNIENWLWQKNKYRRYYIEDIIALYESNPEYWAVVYEESLQELETGNINITKVNGKDINKGGIFSASFQVDYIYDNGLFYGNCVDVTAIATAFHKAVGIPSTFFTYGVIDRGYFKEIHSFPIYYSSQDDLWFNYEKGGNGLYGYSNENIGASNSYDVLFTINKPQVGSDWKMFYKESEIRYNDNGDGGGVENSDIDSGNQIIISTRSYPLRVSESEWSSINKGYQMNELKKYIFCPVSSDDLNRVIAN